ncbi:MAG: EpsI family protein [Acidobacteria bacterium]|nr:EpsI family protein [Acidobacteriota bacterium]
MSFLSGRYAAALSGLLVLQGGVFYAVAMRPETVPVVAPLSTFPAKLGDWRMYQDLPLEKEVQDVLKADDTLNRVYISPDGTTPAFLFIAYFKSQRYGQAPHSPKNCLPGSGWEPVESEPLSIPVPGRAEPISVNRYLVARGEDQSVVLYWYQSHNRIIASEYSAKFWLIADSIRYHRSDSSLVKIVVPVKDGDSETATKAAVEFVKTSFPTVSRQLPG